MNKQEPKAESHPGHLLRREDSSPSDQIGHNFCYYKKISIIMQRRVERLGNFAYYVDKQ
jgi:hypothetical protein